MGYQGPDLESGCRPKLGLSSGGMQVSPSLKVLCGSKWHGFLLGATQSPEVWFRGPQT